MKLFIKNKSNIFNAFYNWFRKIKKKIKNQYYIRIKYIKTDNRTEFNDYKFKSFCLIYDI